MTDRNDGEGGSKKPDYDVGYCRPPKGSQFKPGQSGNPKGRKRQPKSVQAQVRKALSKKVRISEGGKPKWLTYQDLIIRTQLNKAAKGDLKAAAFVLNLARSPEFADADTIDPNSLPAEDQAMFEEMMRQVLGSDLSEPSVPGSQNNAEAEADPPAGDGATEETAARVPDSEDGSDGD